MPWCSAMVVWGGMVFGGTDRERIGRNEDTVWARGITCTLSHSSPLPIVVTTTNDELRVTVGTDLKQDSI